MSDEKKLLIATTVSATLRAFLLPYAEKFRADGWRVDAICREDDGLDDIKDHFDSLHMVRWSRSPLSPRNIQAMSDVASIVRREAYDIVHVHTPVAAFVTRAALRKMREEGALSTGRPKIVYTAHGFHFHNGGSLKKNIIYRSLERRAARWTDRLIVINREDRDAALAMNFVLPEHLLLMPGIGLDFSKYSRASVSLEEALSIRGLMQLKSDDVLFSMLGEFNPGKRHRDVIEALARSNDSHIHVAFAGDGPLKQKIQDMARARGVSANVHFQGFMKDPLPLIRASSATLVPSEREGLSRSAMESICLGVPVIGSDARGVRDVVEHGRGIIYPVGDACALRDAMERIAKEKEEGAIRAVRPDPRWRIEHLLDLHEKLYEELLEEADRDRTDAAKREAERIERERIEAEARAAEQEEIAQRRAEARARKEAARAEKARKKAEAAARRAEMLERQKQEREG